MSTDPHASDSKQATALAPIPVLVGRQAIFDRHLVVHAYELLHRNGVSDSADFDCGDAATAVVMSNAFIDLGLEVVTGGKPAFINLTRELIANEMAHLFPPERIVIEVLEDVEATPEIVEGVRTLKNAGYCIALDDFVFNESLRPLIELADIIKLDILELGMKNVPEQLALLAPYDVELLAEKIETHDEFEACKEMGFDYFQGYFLCRPQIVEAKKSREGGLGLIRLLACINNPDATAADLEDVITKDAKLSYRLMTYINSAAFCLKGRVTSVHHALALLGRRTVRNWANLVVLSSAKGKSNEVLVTALMRARMCQVMALESGQEHDDEYFTVGLFSVLDALLGMTMADIVENLPLADSVINALLMHEGQHGEVLDLAIKYDRSPKDDICSDAFESSLIRKAYIDALEWTSKVMSCTGDESGSN